MAITNLLESVGVGPIIDAQIKIGSTFTKLLQVSEISAKPTFNIAEAKGYNTFALSTKPDSVELKIGLACLQLDLLRALLGSAAIGTTGATPDIVETQNFKVTDLAVYFELYVQSTDITGLLAPTPSDAQPADMWTKFPKCKLTSIDECVPTVKDFLSLSFTAKAIADENGILWSYVLHETNTGIS